MAGVSAGDQSAEIRDRSSLTADRTLPIADY